MNLSRRFAITAVLLAIGLTLVHAESAYQSTKASAVSRPVPSDARIDINTASLDELMIAPGMTRSWAARIVRYRPYRTKYDLIDKGVVSNDVYDRIKDYIIARRTKQ